MHAAVVIVDQLAVDAPREAASVITLVDEIYHVARVTAREVRDVELEIAVAVEDHSPAEPWWVQASEAAKAADVERKLMFVF